MEGEKGRVRKRGWSSSSPSAQSYRLKRTLLMGKRRGSTTPVPTWKIITSQSQSQSQSLQNYRNGANARDSSVSARKLAALLWEIDGRMPSLPTPKMEIFEAKKSEAGMAGKQRILESSKLRSMEHGLPDPSLITVSERILYPTKSCSCRRRALGGSNLRSSTSIPSCLGQSNLKDVYNGLTTSKQLLDVLSRVWGIEQPECISSRLVSALGVELDRSCNRVRKLIQGQKRGKSTEIDAMLKQITIVGEVEAEKKLRRRSERLNKRSGAELAETRACLARAMEELESEKEARRKAERVCEELARGVWELKRQFGKVREEVEREREMFQLADLLREERVQMKLSDAKCLYEEKNALVDKLRNELEASLGDDKRKELQKLLRDSSQENPENEGENDANAKQVEEESDDSDLHSIELSMEEISKSFMWGDAFKNGSKRNYVDATSKGRISKKQPLIQNQKLQMALL